MIVKLENEEVKKAIEYYLNADVLSKPMYVDSVIGNIANDRITLSANLTAKPPGDKDAKLIGI